MQLPPAAAVSYGSPSAPGARVPDGAAPAGILVLSPDPKSGDRRLSRQWKSGGGEALAAAAASAIGQELGGVGGRRGHENIFPFLTFYKLLHL